MRKKEQPSATLPYIFVQAMIWGTYGILFSYANPYMTEKLRLSDTAAGLILCAATALACLLQPLLTAAADRTGLNVRRILAFGGLLTSLCAGATLLPGLGTGATAALFAGSCAGLQILPSFANALGMEGIRGGMRINFGLARGIGSVSFGVTARIAPLLIARIGMAGVAIAGAVTAALLIPSVFLMPEGGRLTAHREEKPTSARDFFRENPKMAGFLLGAILLYVGHNVLSNCMFRVAQLKTPGADDAAATAVQGTALLIAAVVELPAMFLFTTVVKKVRCDRLLLLSCLCMTLRLALTLLLPGAGGLYAAQVMQMLGFALFAVSTVYYVGSVVPERNVVKGQTYLGTANTLGCLVAWVLGGSLIDAVGVERMLIVCIAISAAGFLLALLSRQKVTKTVGA
ncbi:MAG: MFS transporter [Oscillospiraceae bacterium]|nr:MFS transporter [Oscillospiraceae bacterium]